MDFNGIPMNPYGAPELQVDAAQGPPGMMDPSMMGPAFPGQQVT